MSDERTTDLLVAGAASILAGFAIGAAGDLVALALVVAGVGLACGGVIFAVVDLWQRRP